MTPFPESIAAEIMLILMADAKPTSDICDELGIYSIETVRYLVSCMQLLGLVESVAISEGPPRDILWCLSDHALHHREQRLTCWACGLRERMVWGGPVLE